MDDRWGVCIDIEGFSNNFEHSEDRRNFAILGLAELMGAIVHIGRACYPGDPGINFSDRLFVHQFGDGFVICSDSPETDASRGISIALALMRHMILKGYATKAAVSSGSMTDIRGCYPEAIQDATNETVDLGMGIMTIISVMGTALTKAHRLSNTAKGAMLIVDSKLIEYGLPEGVILNSKLNCVDWINSPVATADAISSKARLMTGSAEAIIGKLNEYCRIKPTPPKDWIESTLSIFNGKFA